MIPVSPLSRRAALALGGKAGAALALAGAPAAVLATAGRLAAQGAGLTSDIIAALNLALQLEYLDSTFYRAGLDGGIIPSSDRAIWQRIVQNEEGHVALLQQTLGSAAQPKPNFDYTAGGLLPQALTNYAQFLTLAQAFEDTGAARTRGRLRRSCRTATC
jgi:hypothetical protein